MLTQNESNLINTTAYTHNYIAQYNANAHANNEGCNYYINLFAANVAHSTADDVGGVIIFKNGNKLVAFFDYENLQGTVFN